jgi:hypothetical protein
MDEDDPVCQTCMGTGRENDGVSWCSGGCGGTGRVAGAGESDSAPVADGVGDGNTQGQGVSNGTHSPNNDKGGHKGDGDAAPIGSGGPQVGPTQGGVDNQMPLATPQPGAGGPQTYSKKTSGETRNGQPVTSTDQEDEEDVARRYRAIRRREQFSAE